MSNPLNNLIEVLRGFLKVDDEKIEEVEDEVEKWFILPILLCMFPCAKVKRGMRAKMLLYEGNAERYPPERKDNIVPIPFKPVLVYVSQKFMTEDAKSGFALYLITPLKVFMIGGGIFFGSYGIPGLAPVEEYVTDRWINMGKLAYDFEIYWLNYVEHEYHLVLLGEYGVDVVFE